MAALPDAARMLAWDHDEKLLAFQNLPGIFATHHIDAAPAPFPLPRGSDLGDVSYERGGEALTFHDYLDRQNVVAMLVIKDGQVRAETYRHGTDETTHWTSWSVGKSVVSTLVGIALHNGAVTSLDDQVVRYVPELRGSAYEPVTLRHMLQMSSGVAWSEDPHTPEPNVATFAASLARQEPGAVLEIARSLPRATVDDSGATVEPGTRFTYSNVEAFLVGLALERATGEHLSEYLARHVWHPFGMESDVWWMSESPGGTDSGAGDFSATLRDYGRFGQFVLDDGVLPDGTRTLPVGWMDEATTWAQHTADPAYPNARPGRYGHFWWNHVPDEPDAEGARGTGTTFTAAGLFGQYIIVDRGTRTVMVQWSVYDAPPVDEMAQETATLFAAIARSGQ